MAGNTSPDNITYPTTGDGFALTTNLATMAASIQTAFTNRFASKQANTYVWANAAARTAQTGMTIGDIGYQTDTAFSRAFRREYGEPPAAWRRSRTARPVSAAAAG